MEYKLEFVMLEEMRQEVQIVVNMMEVIAEEEVD